MDENQTTEGKEQTTSTENQTEGDKPREGTIVDKANEAAERLKLENDRKEKLLLKEEELESRRILGGKSGISQPREKEEISNQDYLKMALAGNLPVKQ